MNYQNWHLPEESDGAVSGGKALQESLPTEITAAKPKVNLLQISPQGVSSVAGRCNKRIDRNSLCEFAHSALLRTAFLPKTGVETLILFWSTPVRGLQHGSCKNTVETIEFRECV